MGFSLYGFLYIDNNDPAMVNDQVQDLQEKVTIFTKCAITLSNSLSVRGIPFTLLTNKPDIIEKIVTSENKTLQIKEIPFNKRVPVGIKFYSPHFIIDVFRYFSSLSDPYIGFCDLDVMCINDIPRSLENNVAQKIPMCYDISDQVIPAYGSDIIIRDLETIHGQKSEGRWSGGEFISGSPAFFKVLVNEIDLIYSNYINNIEVMHHVGNETATSAALEILQKKGLYIADAGTLGIIGRFWSVKTLHPQKPFDYFKQGFLLHLPADKRFLASLSGESLQTIPSFINQYENYLKSLQPTMAQRVVLFMKRTIVGRALRWMKHHFHQNGQ